MKMTKELNRIDELNIHLVNGIETDITKIKCPICGKHLVIREVEPIVNESYERSTPYAASGNYRTYIANFDSRQSANIALACKECNTVVIVKSVIIEKYKTHSVYSQWNNEL